MNLGKLLFGFWRKSSAKFGKKRSRILDVFTKTKEDLLKVIGEEQVYVNSLKEKLEAMKAEIKDSNNSIEESKGVLQNIENLLKPA